MHLEGIPTCPRCGSQKIELIGTTNEWEYFCKACDIRFNAKGEVYGGADSQEVRRG